MVRLDVKGFAVRAPSVEHGAMASPRSDIARQISVISATVFMLIAAVVGVGLLGGTPVQDLQDGALGPDATVLAPATPAFRIWSVIYVGLIAFAIWQALPSQRSRERQRAIGWLVALTAVLNGAWLLAAQFTNLPLTVVAIVALLVALSVLLVRTARFPRETRLDAVLIDGVTGLHLGWVALATVANTTAWLSRDLPASAGANAETWGVVVLVVVALIGIVLAWRSARITPALAMSWGLIWLAVGRLAGEPSSALVGFVALGAAGLILLAMLVRGAVRWTVPAT